MQRPAGAVSTSDPACPTVPSPSDVSSGSRFATTLASFSWASSGGSESRIPASPRRMRASGHRVKPSPEGGHLLLTTRSSPARFRMNSCTRRLLPTPASPTTEIRCEVFSSFTRSNTERIRLSSGSRPTIGPDKTGPRGESAVSSSPATSHAVIGPSRPRSSMSSTGFNRKHPRMERAVRSPMRISPGGADS